MNDRCTYCGERAAVLDHAVPYTYAGRSPKRNGGSDPGDRVPACVDCNNHLGGFMFPSLEARRAHILGRLRWKLLESEGEWSEEELSELGPGLRRMVETGLRADRTLRARIAFAEAANS